MDIEKAEDIIDEYIMENVPKGRNAVIKNRIERLSVNDEGDKDNE